jgi:hypothetical protein
MFVHKNSARKESSLSARAGLGRPEEKLRSPPGVLGANGAYAYRAVTRIASA